MYYVHMYTCTDTRRHNCIFNNNNYTQNSHTSSFTIVFTVTSLLSVPPQQVREIADKETVCYCYCHERMCCNQCLYPTMCKIGRCTLSSEICITASECTAPSKAPRHLNANASTELKYSYLLCLLLKSIMDVHILVSIFLVLVVSFIYRCFHNDIITQCASTKHERDC